jgi:hypothetical protein
MATVMLIWADRRVNWLGLLFFIGLVGYQAWVKVRAKRKRLAVEQEKP